MRGRNIFLALILVLFGVFTFENWAEFIEPRELRFLGAHFMGPLGIMLFGLVFGLVAVYAWYTVELEQTALKEAKKFTREVLTNRKAEDDAQNARVEGLKQWLEERLPKKS